MKTRSDRSKPDRAPKQSEKLFKSLEDPLTLDERTRSLKQVLIVHKNHSPAPMMTLRG